MTTTLNATTSNGLVVTPDNSGSTALQANGTTGLTVNAGGFITEPTKPMFQVFGTVGTFSTTNAVVPFNTATVNNGSYYNTSTYTFTAPIAGTYRFTIYGIMGGDGGGQAEVRIRQNSVSQAVMHRNTTVASSTWEQGSVTVILSLALNDTVNCYLLNGSIYLDSTRYSGFCGELIG